MGNVQFDSQGNPSAGSPSLDLNKDTMAKIQKSIIAQPGTFGNQALSNSDTAFNKAVDMSAALHGVGQSLKASPVPPSNYQRTPDNYILTVEEKLAILNKSNELASYGVVPFDVIEGFFYTLAAMTSVSDLSYVAAVTGVDELGDERYVRNVRGITGIQDIYKIGYLANGLSAVTNRYAPQYQSVSNIEDYTQSSTGQIVYQASQAAALGAIGMQVLSATANFTGNSPGILSQTPSYSDSAIASSVGAFSALAGGETTLSPSEINSVLNPASDLQAMSSSLGPQAINSLLNGAPLGGALSSFGALGGVVASMLLGGSGGSAIGGFMSEVLLGQRLKTSQIANNPMLTPPSFQGKSFFGEAPVSLPSTDQTFCKRVAAFGSPKGGNGVVSFNMQNFASMGSAMSVASLVSSMITGSSDIPDPSNHYGQEIATITSNLANVMNVSPTSSIEPRRSDHAIPFMLAFSAVSVGETHTPFPSNHFTDGWKLASSAANDIQKANPQFLQTCRTSL